MVLLKVAKIWIWPVARLRLTVFFAARGARAGLASLAPSSALAFGSTALAFGSAALAFFSFSLVSFSFAIILALSLISSWRLCGGRGQPQFWPVLCVCVNWCGCAGRARAGRGDG